MYLSLEAYSQEQMQYFSKRILMEYVSLENSY
jgi:hypothetical protein